MIVADASVVLKWFFPDEEDHERALALKQRHVAGESLLAAPDFLMYEAANVLQIRRSEIRDAKEGFSVLCSVAIQFHALEIAEFAHSMELAHRYKISVYDACYVVLAQALRCRFVTTDQRLLAHLKGIPNLLHLREVVP